MTDAPASGSGPDPEPAHPPPEEPPPAHPPPAVPPEELPPPAVPPVALVSTRHLLAASFDLLGRSADQMRRASFYIGAVVLGTAGPLAVGSWALAVMAVDRLPSAMEDAFGSAGGVVFGFLGVLAAVGLTVAAIESRILGVAVLGARLADRPMTTRAAIARSRAVFWRAVGASIVAAIPLGIVQGAVTAVLDPILREAADLSLVVTTIITAIVASPFAYMLSGVVLGDVGPIEAMRRSFRLFRARKAAAAVVVVFETIAAVLVVLGLTAGLDVVLRVFDSLGLGTDAGPAGLILTTIGVVAVVFASGTLLYTVMAITLAPQVVMFLGLTHATIGIDRVVPGGPDDPDRPHRRGQAFRTFPRLMQLAFVLGAIGLVALVLVFLV